MLISLHTRYSQLMRPKQGRINQSLDYIHITSRIEGELGGASNSNFRTQQDSPSFPARVEPHGNNPTSTYPLTCACSKHRRCTATADQFPGVQFISQLLAEH